MSFPPLLGPIAPERNPTIEPQFYQPSVFEITALTRGRSTTITTSTDHNYVVGQQVRLNVPNFYGTFQISGLQGIVTSIPADDQAVVNIDSTNFNVFISNPSYGPTKPQIWAIGDVNTGQIISTGRNSTLSQLTIQGSFENISPCPVGTFV